MTGYLLSHQHRVISRSFSFVTNESRMDRPRSNDDREGTSNIYQKMSYFLESLKTDLSNGLILKDNGLIPVELLTNVLLMLSGSVNADILCIVWYEHVVGIYIVVIVAGEL